MTTKRLYQCSLALPILVPLILFVVGYFVRLREKSEALDGIATVIALSGVIGGIPYIILAISLLFWMRNKGEAAIRKALLLSPLLMIPLLPLGVCFFFYKFFGNSYEVSGYEVSVKAFFFFYLFFVPWVLFIGYAYVGLTFAIAKLFGKERLA